MTHEFRIFTNEEQTTYYHITDKKPSNNIQEYGIITDSHVESVLSNAAINFPTSSLELTVWFHSDEGEENFEERILNIPIGHPIYSYLYNKETKEMEPDHKWYITSIAHNSSQSFTFTCEDEYYKLKDYQYGGGYYEDTPLSTVLENTLYKIYPNSVLYQELENSAVTGYFKPQNFLSFLQELCLTQSIVIFPYLRSYNSFTDVDSPSLEVAYWVSNLQHPFWLNKTPVTYKYIELDKIINTYTTTNNSEYSTLKTSIYNYKRTNTLEEIYNGVVYPQNVIVDNTQYYGAYITFDKPYDSYSITNGRLVYANRGGSVVVTPTSPNQPVKITAFPYELSTQDIYYTFNNKDNINSVKAVDLPSITEVTYDSIRDNLSNYYSSSPNITIEVIMPWEDFYSTMFMGRDIYIRQQHNNTYYQSKVVGYTYALLPTDNVVLSLDVISAFLIEPPQPMKVLDHIEIIQEPETQYYEIFSYPDFTGLKIRVYWQDGSTEDLEDGFVVVPNDYLTEAGYATYTVYYQHNTVVATDTFRRYTLDVIHSIMITHVPNKVLYRTGEQVDYTGMVVMGLYTNTQQYVQITLDQLQLPAVTVSASDGAQIPITISYTQPYSNKTVSATLYVYKKMLDKIFITQNPNKVLYNDFDSIDYTGMRVYAEFLNQSELEEISLTDPKLYLPSYTFDYTSPEIVELHIRYTYDEILRGAYLQVYHNPSTLNYIKITNPPTKTLYESGESFDPTGMVVTAYFTTDEGEKFTAILPSYNYSVDPLLGNRYYDFPVSFEYNGEVFTDTTPITIFVRKYNVDEATFNNHTVLSDFDSVPIGVDAPLSTYQEYYEINGKKTILVNDTIKQIILPTCDYSQEVQYISTSGKNNVIRNQFNYINGTYTLSMPYLEYILFNSTKTKVTNNITKYTIDDAYTFDFPNTIPFSSNIYKIYEDEEGIWYYYQDEYGYYSYIKFLCGIGHPLYEFKGNTTYYYFATKTLNISNYGGNPTTYTNCRNAYNTQLSLKNYEYLESNSSTRLSEDSIFKFYINDDRTGQFPWKYIDHDTYQAKLIGMINPPTIERNMITPHTYQINNYYDEDGNYVQGGNKEYLTYAYFPNRGSSVSYTVNGLTYSTYSVHDKVLSQNSFSGIARPDGMPTKLLIKETFKDIVGNQMELEAISDFQLIVPNCYEEEEININYTNTRLSYFFNLLLKDYAKTPFKSMNQYALDENSNYLAILMCIKYTLNNRGNTEYTNFIYYNPYNYILPNFSGNVIYGDFTSYLQYDTYQDDGMLYPLSSNTISVQEHVMPLRTNFYSTQGASYDTYLEERNEYFLLSQHRPNSIPFVITRNKYCEDPHIISNDSLIVYPVMRGFNKWNLQVSSTSPFPNPIETYGNDEEVLVRSGVVYIRAESTYVKDGNRERKIWVNDKPFIIKENSEYLYDKPSVAAIDNYFYPFGFLPYQGAGIDEEKGEYFSFYTPNGLQKFYIWETNSMDICEYNTGSNASSTIKSFKIITEPTNKDFIIGDKLDYSGIEIQAQNALTDEWYKSYEYEILTPDMSTAGIKPVTVYYTRNHEYYDGYNITVKDVYPLNIQISKLPDITSYIKDTSSNTFTLDGIEITLNLSDGTTRAIPSSLISYNSPDFSKEGTQVITIKYIRNKKIFTDSFSIYVNDGTLEGINLVNIPSKTIYRVGETLDLTGLQVEAVYQDGQTRLVNGYNVTTPDMSTEGVKEVIIDYSGYTASYNIKVYYNYKIEVSEIIQTKDLPINRLTLKNDNGSLFKDDKVFQFDSNVVSQYFSFKGALNFYDIYGNVIETTGEVDLSCQFENVYFYQISYGDIPKGILTKYHIYFPSLIFTQDNVTYNTSLLCYYGGANNFLDNNVYEGLLDNQNYEQKIAIKDNLLNMYVLHKSNNLDFLYRLRTDKTLNTIRTELGNTEYNVFIDEMLWALSYQGAFEEYTYDKTGYYFNHENVKGTFTSLDTSNPNYNISDYHDCLTLAFERNIKSEVNTKTFEWKLPSLYGFSTYLSPVVTKNGKRTRYVGFGGLTDDTKDDLYNLRMISEDSSYFWNPYSDYFWLKLMCRENQIEQISDEVYRFYFVDGTTYDFHVWNSLSFPEKKIIDPITTNVVSIEITTLPSKTNYYLGDSLDTSGMVVTANLEDGNTQIISDYSVVAPDMNSTGLKTVTVVYGSFTDSYNITVVENPKVVSSISVTTPPNRVSYLLNESFDPTGMVVTAYYQNGNSETVNNYSITSPDMSTAGQKDVIISYSGVSTALAITVVGDFEEYIPNLLSDALRVDFGSKAIDENGKCTAHVDLDDSFIPETSALLLKKNILNNKTVTIKGIEYSGSDIIVNKFPLFYSSVFSLNKSKSDVMNSNWNSVMVYFPDVTINGENTNFAIYYYRIPTYKNDYKSGLYNRFATAFNITNIEIRLASIAQWPKLNLEPSATSILAANWDSYTKDYNKIILNRAELSRLQYLQEWTDDTNIYTGVTQILPLFDVMMTLENYNNSNDIFESQFIGIASQSSGNNIFCYLIPYMLNSWKETYNNTANYDIFLQLSEVRYNNTYNCNSKQVTIGIVGDDKNYTYTIYDKEIYPDTVFYIGYKYNFFMAIRYNFTTSLFTNSNPSSSTIYSYKDANGDTQTIDLWNEVGYFEFTRP